jgi:crotonobetainyl-CoA:carnitine CoA-transferase CaiB-like acyl-CoA transferase
MTLTPPGLEWPVGQRPAFGDVMGGMTIAGGIAAALYRRERTGTPSTIDVSLLGVALWNLGPDVVASRLFENTSAPRFTREDLPNPIVGIYKTKDGRFISLVMLESDRFWPDLCRHLGHEELIDDPRFRDAAARFENRRECIRLLDEIFATRTYAEWRETLATAEGVWAPLQTVREVHDDVQVIANGYLPELHADNGTPYWLVANPVQFDETPPELGRAPEHGQHTEEVLLELGLTWDEIIAHKESGAIL